MSSRSNFRRIRHSNFAKCLKTLCFVKPPVIEAGYCLGLIEPATHPLWKWKLTCYSFIKCINRELFFSISQSLTLALDKQSIPTGLASAPARVCSWQVTEDRVLKSKDTLEGETLRQVVAAGYSFMLLCFLKYCNASTVRE